MKRARFLLKRHLRLCTNRRRGRERHCDCAWRGRYKGEDVQLAKWSGKQVDPRNQGAALVVLARVITAIDEGHFDARGERAAKGTGQTLAEWLDDWHADKVERANNSPTKRGTRSTSLVPMLDVIKAGYIGSYTLQHLAERAAVEEIEEWLDETGKARKWRDKTWNEYHGLLKRTLARAVKRGRLSRNPLDDIDRRHAPKRRGQAVRHLRLDEAQEDALFAACPLLDVPKPAKHTKLTQENAEAIRRRHAEGERQNVLAAAFRVAASVICAVLQGKIHNPEGRRATTYGAEMARRLMVAFDCGLRAAEMLLTQVKHVDWSRPTWEVAPDGTRYKAYVLMLPPTITKGGASSGEVEEVIAGTLRMSLMLERRRMQLKNNPEAYLFGTESGAYVGSFDKPARRLFKLAGVKWGRYAGYVWHTTRHEFISRTAETTKDPVLTQEQARHADLATTQPYFHTRRDRKRSAAVGLNRVSG